MKTIQFRPLNDNELHLLAKMGVDANPLATRSRAKAAMERGEEIRVAYRYQEHRQSVEYTVALVQLGDGSLLVGATKRNPSDPANPIKGQVEALRRAFSSEVLFKGSRVDTP